MGQYCMEIFYWKAQNNLEPVIIESCYERHYRTLKTTLKTTCGYIFSTNPLIKTYNASTKVVKYVRVPSALLKLSEMNFTWLITELLESVDNHSSYCNIVF